MHEGGDKSAVPRNWQIYDKEKYRMVTHLFQEYLATCYSKCYASTHPKPVVHNHPAQEERDTCKLPSGLDGLISMDELPGDLDTIGEVAQDMEKSGGARKKANTTAGTNKRKAKKRPRKSPDSSIEQSEDDGSTAEDNSDGDSDSDEDEDEDEDISNCRRRSPLPYSAPKVNYGVPVGSSARRKSRIAKLKNLYRRADSRVKGK